jgi:putative sterol carrier protein
MMLCHRASVQGAYVQSNCAYMTSRRLGMGVAMTAEFFDQLADRGNEPLLHRADATVRFDVADGDRVEHRLVRIDHGNISVSSEEAPADCVVAADRTVFDDVISGRTTTMAALLRGVLAAEGQPELLVLIQRLFSQPVDPVGAGERRSS